MYTNSDDTPGHSFTNNDDNSNTLKPVSVITNFSHSLPHIMLPSVTHTNHNNNYHLKHIDSNFDSTPVIVIELTDNNSLSGSWHPLKWAKFLTNNFVNINNILNLTTTRK